MSATVRPMTAADLPVAMAISARAFGIELSTAAARERWHGRVAHALGTDPEGAFVAEVGGEVVGVAEAMIREGLWVLSLLTVDPERQSAGAGRALMRAALGYGGDGPGLIVASDDARALRLYGAAGFRLIPCFRAAGVLDADRLGPSDDEIIVVPEHEFGSLGAIAGEIRGAAWTAELLYAAGRGSTVFALSDRGLVVATPGEGIWALAARDERSAVRLLRRGLAHAAGPEPIGVRWLTGAQQWAIATLLELGMQLQPYGAICVRGHPGTLAPYVPSAPFA